MSPTVHFAGESAFSFQESYYGKWFFGFIERGHLEKYRFVNACCRLAKENCDKLATITALGKEAVRLESMTRPFLSPFLSRLRGSRYFFSHVDDPQFESARVILHCDLRQTLPLIPISRYADAEPLLKRALAIAIVRMGTTGGTAPGGGCDEARAGQELRV